MSAVQSEAKPHVPAASPAPPRTLARGKLRLIGDSEIFVAAKHKADIESSTYDGKERVSTRFPQCNGWIRLGRLVPRLEGEPGMRLRVSVSIAAPSVPVTVSAISINRLTPAGSFEIVRRVAAKSTFTEQKAALSFTLPPNLAAELAAADAQEELYLFLEFHSPFELNDLSIDFSFVEPPPYTLPYITSNHLLAQRLVEHNAAVSQQARTARSHYLLDQAELSVRLDCLETAFGILSQINPSDITNNLAFRRLLWTATEVMIAHGHTEKLKDVLLTAYSCVKEDDGLFTALSLCFPADATHAPHFEVLPSGKPNRNYISRLSDGSFGLRTLRKGLEALTNLDDAMLLASDLRSQSPTLYGRMWAKFMTGHNLQPFTIEQSEKKTNILDRVHFDSLPSETGDKKVSVIMSAYNSETTIAYAIQSILNQTYSNFELLVCDDRSSDETLSVMRNFQGHPRVRLFQSKDNQGPYNIRSGLIKESTGELITFQDADDYAHPQRLSIQVASLIDGKKFSMGKWVRIRPDGEIIFFRDQLCLRMCVVSLMVPRSIFREFNAYRPVLCGGDSELYENLRTEFGPDSIAHIDAPIILGLWSDRSLTRSDGLEATEDGFRSKARRIYAEASARQRLLGTTIVPDEDIDEMNKGQKIFRLNHGVQPL